MLAPLLAISVDRRFNKALIVSTAVSIDDGTALAVAKVVLV